MNLDATLNQTISHIPETILLVEDHDILRQTMHEWLMHAFPNNQFKVACNANEAIGLISEDMPRLIITDINMPGVDGLELTERVKTELPGIDVVIVSSYDDHLYRSKAIACGASAYVPKHLMQTDLIPIISAIINHDVI